MAGKIRQNASLVHLDEEASQGQPHEPSAKLAELGNYRNCSILRSRSPIHTPFRSNRQRLFLLERTTCFICCLVSMAEPLQNANSSNPHHQFGWRNPLCSQNRCWKNFPWKQDHEVSTVDQILINVLALPAIALVKDPTKTAMRPTVGRR